MTDGKISTSPTTERTGLFHIRTASSPKWRKKLAVAGSGKHGAQDARGLTYDRDGHLDLMIANYVDFDLATAPAPGERPSCMWKGVPVMCGPRRTPRREEHPLHNRGDGTFEDVTTKAHIDRTDGHYAFSVSTLDFDDDGWLDIYVACDSTPSILYRNNHDGTFTDVGVTAGASVQRRRPRNRPAWALPSETHGDGRLDIFKTNFSDDTSRSTEITATVLSTMVTTACRTRTLYEISWWGTIFLDVDNDAGPIFYS